MSDPMDYYRLYKKPQYEGDFLTQMFDWNLNSDFNEKETSLTMEEMAKPVMHEDFEMFEQKLSDVKFIAKH